MDKLALVGFDLFVELATRTPALLEAFGRIAQSKADPEVIAAERKAITDGFDTTDPLRPGL